MNSFIEWIKSKCHTCKKFGKVENGYQYCLECGKAISAPKLKHECIWKTLNTYTVKTRRYTGTFEEIMYIQQCTICGVIKKVIIC